jgi:hypothetical protein
LCLFQCNSEFPFLEKSNKKCYGRLCSWRWLT